jgi:cation diffusion facilitator CzcD-associated flavoprotein CzcO
METEVASLHNVDGTWIARTTTGVEIQARAVVIATGIVSNPHIPDIPGRDRFGGRVLHSVEYRRPDGFTGKRVLVVGAGNSAGEISVELARAGADVTLAVRSGAFVVPREIAGIPIQYLSVALASLPNSAQRAAAAIIGRLSSLVRGPAMLPPPPRTDCPNVPLIGFQLADLLRAGTIRLKGGVVGFSPGGARFSDDSEQPFDAVILATGYRAAVGMLRGLIRLDDCGFARRRNKVVSVDQPGLYFVGHNYDIRGGLFNIGRDGRLAAGWIKAAVHGKSRTSIGTPPRSSER